MGGDCCQFGMRGIHLRNLIFIALSPALFNFDAADPTQLSLQVGDLLYLLEEGPGQPLPLNQGLIMTSL